MTAGEPGTDLDRERTRALRASEDANRAERELLAARARVAKLEGQLAQTQRRLDALQQRRSVRLATGIGGRLAAVASAVRGKRGEVQRPGADPEPGAPARSFPGTAARDVPERLRETLLGALDDPTGPGGPFRIMAAGPTEQLTPALAARGLDVVTRPEAGPDAIIVTDPAVDPLRLPVGPIMVGVHPADSEEFDVLVGPSDDPAGAVVEAMQHWLRARRVGIRVPAANADVADSWGDTHLARGLRRALRDAGWPTRLHLRNAWDRPSVGGDDVVVDLFGLHEASSQPGAVRILWQISHPELARPDLYERYDAVFVASDSFAARMGSQVSVPVRPLHQATDPARFKPQPGGPQHDLLFVGGWRQAGRRILEDLLPTQHDLAVYGGRWTTDRMDPRHLRGEAIPNDALAAYYASASIVLNDHWAGMRREGFLSNRLYDASAAGAFVITDDVDGLDAEFDGGVVGYLDRNHLRELIDRFLADSDGRRAHAERARAAVLARHTFAHRARSLIDAIEPMLGHGPAS